MDQELLTSTQGKTAMHRLLEQHISPKVLYFSQGLHGKFTFSDFFHFGRLVLFILTSYGSINKLLIQIQMLYTRYRLLETKSLSNGLAL